MRNQDNAPEYLEAVRRLTMALLAPETATAAAPAAHQAMLDGLVEVRQARMQRLALMTTTSTSMNWAAMLVLGVLTQVAVAVVQLDKMRPQALALFVFTTAFAATVALIGLARQPYASEDVDAGPLRAAIASVTP